MAIPKVLFLLSTLIFSGSLSAQSPYVLILGTAQDGGHPQAGCEKSCCKSTYDNPQEKHWVSSIALVDPQTNDRWIFDATPDFTDQFHLLKTKTNDFSGNLNGFFLTHAHIGHYTGLMNLGHEAMGANAAPVYAMPKMSEFLKNNGPWSQLVNYKNIELKPLQNQQIIKLNERISIQPFTVPHRDEFSETVGYRIMVDSKSLIFIPDIDKWSKWETSLNELVKSVDYALLDGTFFADGEIPRPMSEVPHPFVTETMDLLKNLSVNDRKKVHFIHLNHTNPLLDKTSDSYKQVLKNGFQIAETGNVLEL
ncbi:MAG: pyrroloquinoline quinone biosynthesis protein B [Spirosomataceae bacterium]|jgi:pyrroloquinoline quinone biosynthesis protein B